MDKQPFDSQSSDNADGADSAWWRDGLKTALALPASVYMAGGASQTAAAALPSATLPSPLRSASAKRKTEYLAGRHCAFAALRAAACDAPAPPAMGADRLPQWPSGWLGSITHSSGEAVAAVSRIGATRLLGIDVETLIEPASVDGIAALVAQEDEMALLLEPIGGCTPSQALTILFSAKESLYKALYPDTQRFMDFSAARVQAFTPASLRLTLALTEDWHPVWRTGSLLSVNYAMRGDRVYTALHLAQSNS
ncbi:MAG: 4-phosphopantetheinyl transferase superfamily protein [Herbaspirillum sp.]|jgi:enterobactin synthetase component D|nr:4-phosphopantetheinyl transferase superfamily protein [Herbaspirillum sp.]